MKTDQRCRNNTEINSAQGSTGIIIRARFFALLRMTVILLIISSTGYCAFTDKPGARPIGMAGAFVSVADDINSMYYNPAGLGTLNNIQITGMYDQQHIGLGFNMNYGYVGSVLPVDSIGTFGVSGSQSATELYREYVFNLSYGTSFTKNIFVGANGKYLIEKYTENEYTQLDPLFLNNGYSINSFAFDVGGLMAMNELRIGAMLENIGLNPMNIKLGCSYRIGNFTPTIEVNYKTRKISGKQDINYMAATEYKLTDNFVVRVGGNLYNLSVGISYGIENIGIDYGFKYPIAGIEGSYGSHCLQLTYKFETSQETETITDRPEVKPTVISQDETKKVALAILELEANNVSQSLASSMGEFLRLEFFKAKRYEVIERKNIDKILKEQQLQQTGCTSSECAIEIGKILNVKYVIVGSVNKIGSKYAIQIRLVDVENATIVSADMTECYNEEEFTNSARELTQKIDAQIRHTK